MNLDEIIQQLKSIEQTKISSSMSLIKRSSDKYQAEDFSTQEFYLNQLDRLKRFTYSAKDERMERNLHEIEQHIANINSLLVTSPHLKASFALVSLGLEDEKKRIKKEMIRFHASSRQNQRTNRSSINYKSKLSSANQLDRQADHYLQRHSMSRPNSQKNRISHFPDKKYTYNQHQYISRSHSQNKQLKKDKTYSRRHQMMNQSLMLSNNNEKLENQSNKYGIGHDQVKRKTRYQQALFSKIQKNKPEKFEASNKNEFSSKSSFNREKGSKNEKEQNKKSRMICILKQTYKEAQQQSKKIDLRLNEQFEKLVDKLAKDPKNESLKEKCDTVIQSLQKKNMEKTSLIFSVI